MVWTPDKSKAMIVRVLVRMMRQSGSTFTEVELKAGGDWAPKQVYCMKHFSDILSVESDLVDI